MKQHCRQKLNFSVPVAGFNNLNNDIISHDRFIGGEDSTVEGEVSESSAKMTPVVKKMCTKGHIQHG
jgi:hypothetical protein